MRGADGKRLPLWLNTRTLTSHFCTFFLCLFPLSQLIKAIAHAVFGPYVLFPIAAALTWLGGILALLGLWVVAGKPRYRSNEASVVFISNVGATHQALFIAICCTVAA